MNDSDTPQGQDNTAEHERNHPNSSSPIVNVPSVPPTAPTSPSKHAYADDCENSTPWWKKLDTYRFVAELAILVITVRIACIYSDQLNQMIESNRLTRENFQRDQRPYVWWAVSNADFFADRVVMTVALADFGKTPAVDVRIKGKVFLGKDAVNQSEVWFGGFGDGTRFPTNDTDVTNPGIIPPGVLPSKPTEAASGYFVYGVSSDLTDQASVLSAQALDQGVVTAIRIEYSGTTGDFHYSEICLLRKLNGRVNQQGHPDGSITSCPQGKSIH